MKITDLLLSNKNRPRTKINPKYLVIHWTANENKGAHARANRNYFQNTDRFASAHYLVDSTEVIRALPENEMGYHVGAKSYRHNTCRNSNSIGIEMCVNADGNFTKMYALTVQLAADICKRHGFNVDTQMIRHYDVTGKDCPRFFVQKPQDWAKFKADVKAAMKPPVPQKPKEVVKSVSEIKPEEDDVLKLSDYQWKQLEATLSAHNIEKSWAEKAKKRELTISELTWLNTILIERLAK